MRLQKVTLAQAQYVAHELAKELMPFNEEIPDFTTRYPGVLESCLEQPFQSIGGQPVYRYLPHRAAVMFYLIIKNHPFLNGNKRLAVTITMVFFYINGKWIDVPAKELYDVACGVAKSKGSESERATYIKALTIFFKHNMRSR